MPYFSLFGNQNYTFSDGSTSLINDITKFAVFQDAWVNNPSVQLQYQIKDGELPHSISNKLYDTVDYWWIVLLANKIYDFDEMWPRTSNQLDDYIANKYPFNIPTDVHHYIRPNGTVTDLLSVKLARNVTTDQQAIDIEGLTSVSIFDYEFTLNESKRNIVLIDPEYVGVVVSQFQSVMSNG